MRHYRPNSFSRFEWHHEQWIWNSLDVFGSRDRFYRDDWAGIFKAETDDISRYWLAWTSIGLDRSERLIFFLL